jgi:hypothetical protein
VSTPVQRVIAKKLMGLPYMTLKNNIKILRFLKSIKTDFKDLKKI